MTPKPQASVVITAFNEEKHLPQTLQSLKNQTVSDFELIIVDNNSTDKTAAIAKRFGATVIPEKEQGMTPAREAGFRAAKADIIVKLDADTILAANWLERVVYFFSQEKSAVGVHGNFKSPSQMAFQGFFFEKITVPSYYKISQLLLGHHVLTGPAYAIRKSAWQKVKIHKNDQVVHEDIDLSCHLCDIGNIHHHSDLIAIWSNRRLKQPPKKVIADLYDYSRRFFKTIFLHHPKLKRHPQKGPDR